MKPIDRRTFLSGSAAAALLTGLETAAARAANSEPADPVATSNATGGFNAAVDFRYAPEDFQSTICFPDDPVKTLVGKWGDLRCDFPHDQFAGINAFGTIVEFTLAGMNRDQWVEQTMEAPGIPIVHTRIDRPAATMELTTFATHRPGEGRVDNVLLEVRARGEDVTACPLVRIRSCDSYDLLPKNGSPTVVVRKGETAPWMLCLPQHNPAHDIWWVAEEGGFRLTLEHGTATRTKPLRYFFRMPQAGAANVDANADPGALLDEVRAWWKQWQAFHAPVAWTIPGREGDFLTACARNIQQAREVKNGQLVFEVGPTVYRGLWIVDGNFLLEAARYLGFDDAADEGLLSEWGRQVPSGQIIASGGKEHWKDTAIAMFTLVRACELKQDWGLLRRLAPNVGHAIEFLIGLRDEARKGDSPNGRYGLLAPGFPDGGIAGVCNDFTNTLWTLAGLRAVAAANDQLKLPDLARAAGFYTELRSAFDNAARQEMVRDPRGFTYLPMLMHDDPQMHADAWDRPRPQSAQWALSHTIFPGEVFAKDDPVVRGHIALMQACTEEDIPAETGWLRHGGVWNYNAAFVAEVYLWAGLRDWAHRTFTGYLNHASPLHAWREEQPLQRALLGDNWGDMPHNWASAECIRYLRHMLALEDGSTLRLLDGLAPSDLQERKPFALAGSPTRFGRISLAGDPEGRRGWKLRFTREASGPAPQTVTLPEKLDAGAALTRIEGAAKRSTAAGMVSIDPAATSWTATWES
ncbi:MAG TPA: hypothetical protein VHX60_17755 [Acidobacteriaceae bacterium]|jgi:hypothetical protein|nr:hypothetical protein [Acidobacteriaceae bacterium]